MLFFVQIYIADGIIFPKGRDVVLAFAYHLQLFKEIFFPRTCSICSRKIQEGCFCYACRDEYLLQKKLYWGNTAVDWQEKKHWCMELTEKELLYDARLLYRYDGKLKKTLHSIKFEDRAELLPLLREEAGFALAQDAAELSQWLGSFDIISFIPTSRERLLRRGFDVPTELFAGLGQGQLKRKLQPDLLLRKRSTAPLYKLSPEERKTELTGCFKINSEVLKKLAVESRRAPAVLLCDDIVTTYGTVLEAAKTLLEAGAGRVSLLAFTAAKNNW